MMSGACFKFRLRTGPCGPGDMLDGRGATLESSANPELEALETASLVGKSARPGLSRICAGGFGPRSAGMDCGVPTICNDG